MILFVLAVSACGDGQEKVPVKNIKHEMDSLFSAGKVDFSQKMDTGQTPTIQMTPPTEAQVEADVDPETEEVVLVVHVGRIERGPKATKIALEATMAADTVSSYTIKVSAVQHNVVRPKPAVAPSKSNEYIIKKGDTKTNLEKRFGPIKNKAIIAGQKLIQ